MQSITSREYKVMLDHRMFAERQPAATAFHRELHALANGLRHVDCDGEFSSTEKREIVFLDTADQAIFLNGLVLRQRIDVDREKAELTLKCRSPDRYVAAGANMRAAAGMKAKSKFEEDIGAPFLSRFSHSNTVKGVEKPPKNLKQAAKVFPILGELERDGETCPGSLKLGAVNLQGAFERVVTGPLLTFHDTEAEIALILWSDGPGGRPLVAEFSFRYPVAGDMAKAETARRAMTFFRELQNLDWCAPMAKTKTQYVYEK